MWGVCLGFELMNVIEGGKNLSIITKVDSENICLNVKFTEGKGLLKQMCVCVYIFSISIYIYLVIYLL